MSLGTDGGTAGWTVTPKYPTVFGACTATYTSGDGTDTLIFTLSRGIYPSTVETCSITYVNPGDGLVGVVDFGPTLCTNNSTHTSGESFLIDFSSVNANIFGGDGTGELYAAAELTNEVTFDGGSQVFKGSGGFPLLEFNTNPTGIAYPDAPVNPDFNWAEGRFEAYIRWTGTWPSGNAQLFSLKNELGSTSGRVPYFRGGTEGSIRFFGSNPITITGFTKDGWHKLTGTWDETGPGGVYATLQLNADTVGNRTVALVAADADPTQILIGNDTSSAATFYVGFLRVWNNAAGT